MNGMRVIIISVVLCGIVFCRANTISQTAEFGISQVDYPDGAHYSGEMAGGKREGRGAMLYPDGSYYRGQWKDDRRHGNGVYILSDGSRYKGPFTDDRPDGTGVFTASDGRKKSVTFRGGVIENSQPVSFSVVKGELRYGTFYFDGKYTGWHKGSRMYGYKQHGRGIMVWPDGCVYTGQWKEGKMHGRGMMKWEDGSTYTGQWSNGKRVGRGVYQWASGNRYVGQWMDNFRHGVGIAYLSDGKVLAGRFENDRFVGN